MGNIHRRFVFAGLATTLTWGIAGCSDEDAPRDPSPGGGGGAGGDPGEEFQEPEGCFELGSDSAAFSLAQMRDDFPEECGDEEGVNDVAMVWRAPQAGRFKIVSRLGDLAEWNDEGFREGSVLYSEIRQAPQTFVRKGSCETTGELICSKSVNYEEGDDQQLVVLLEEGEEITISVQGAPDPVEGAFDEPVVEGDLVASIEITEVECVTEELGSSTLVEYEGYMDGSGSPIGPVSCTASEWRASTERGFRYIAPETGTYRAWASDTSGEPLGLAQMDAACGEELQCAPGVEDGVVEIEFEATEGEEIVLIASAENYPDEGYNLLLGVELLSAN